jgi:phosphoglycerate dehydrogenase-like enzyme
MSNKRGSMMDNMRVGFVGFGEVGRIFAAGLKAAGVPWVGAWDLKFDEPALRDAMVAPPARSAWCL